MTSRRRRDEQEDETPVSEVASAVEEEEPNPNEPPPVTTFEVRADEYGSVELKSGRRSFGRNQAGALLTFPIEEKPE